MALPLSLIGTFGVMALLGYGLDNLSLMALTVATGFVVDDAIVMIENVVRYIEQGEPPLAAAYKGAAQIGFTIVSLTVSLIAVFIPLLFMTGVVGRLFSEFAVTLSVAVVVSAVVSLTLTPMMCGRLLRPAPSERPWLVARLAEAGFQRLLAGYARTLRWSLRHQTLMLVVAAGTLVGTIVLYVIVPKGFLPLQDTGVIVAVTEAEQSISIPRMSALQAQAAAIVRADPAVAGGRELRRRRRDQPHPQHRPADHRAEAAPRARRRGRAPSPPGCRRGSPPFPGLSVFMQPVQDIQIGTRISRTQFQYTLIDTDPAELAHWAPRLLEASASLCRRCATSPPTSRMTGSAPSSASTATPPCGSACRCRRCRTRSTTRSASARSRPSSARPTSTGWCWRPTRPGRPIPVRWRNCACPGPGCRARRCRCPPSPPSSASPRRWPSPGRRSSPR